MWSPAAITSGSVACLATAEPGKFQAMNRHMIIRLLRLRTILCLAAGGVFLVGLLAGCVPEQRLNGAILAQYKLAGSRKSDPSQLRRQHIRLLREALTAEQLYVDMMAAMELGLQGPILAGSVMEAVRPLLGVPYLWGGETALGLDCSGFTRLVYRKLGVNLPRTSREQARVGASVALESLQAGDLVFFSVESSTIDHVGVMVSAQHMAHSAGKRGRVVIEPMRRAYPGKFAGARRVGRKSP